MVHEIICSHVDVQALQARSDERLIVKLVSLESVRIAHESYALLCPLVELRSSWLCPHLDLLSLLAGLAKELHKVEHDLLPPLMVQEAKLEGGVLEALVLLKSSAMTLLRLGECIKENREEKLGESLEDEDEFSDRVEEVGVHLQDTADHVLKGTRKIVFLQARVPVLLQLVKALLAIPFFFPSSE
ncbi:unnamed protein product [Urochloa decumbens]|uniref:Uncharacterized protein n=1 Tax=Urochloa decumbens TaxID=240449 RepID=A0ABC9FZC2_9POAL